MILALDVGNSQIFAGAFDGERLKLQFRKSSKNQVSSDEIGVFFRTALRENGINPEKIRQISISSVVPDLVHSLTGACQKYFDVQPFLLRPGTKTGLRIRYNNPLEVGSDRIANAIAATRLYPGKNVLIIDFGTATTFSAVTADRDYLGGPILPGLRLSMEALESGTARLPVVEIVKPQELVPRSTVESIQSGLYFGHLAMAREIGRGIREQCFRSGETIVLGTGGFGRLFDNENAFDAFAPDLVLQGLRFALDMNPPEKKAGEKK
jgi:type III pantothenate kinase